MNREATLTRQELYRQVWEKPATHIAKELGVTLYAVLAACREYDIPRPGCGYWMQKEFGKAPARPALPPRPDDETVILRRPSDCLKPKKKREEPPRVVESTERPEPVPPLPTPPEQEPAASPAVPLKPDAVVVPDTLVRPHALIARARRNLRGAKADYKGYLEPKEKPCLDVRVTRASLGRALLVMDTLLKALEARGFSVELRDGTSVGTYATVHGEKLEIWIEEKVTRREKPLSPTEQRKKERDSFYYHLREYVFVPTGELALRMDGHFGWTSRRRTWADGKRNGVEGHLNRFIEGLVDASETVRRVREEREKEEREREERRRRAQELARLKQEEKARLETLEQEVNGWHKAKRIREYVEAVRYKSESLDETPGRREALAQWSEWALRQADRADPLCDSPPSVLDEPDVREYFW